MPVVEGYAGDVRTYGAGPSPPGASFAPLLPAGALGALGERASLALVRGAVASPAPAHAARWAAAGAGAGGAPAVVVVPRRGKGGRALRGGATVALELPAGQAAGTRATHASAHARTHTHTPNHA